jgi:hypothetical protein
VTDLDEYTGGADLVRYTPEELESAKNRAQLIGWAQGGGAVILGGIVLNLLGWIPTLLVAGGVVYVLYKLLSKSSD